MVQAYIFQTRAHYNNYKSSLFLSSSLSLLKRSNKDYLLNLLQSNLEYFADGATYLTHEIASCVKI